MAVDAVVLKREGFTYGGQSLAAGEIFQLRGLPNDGRLVDLGYITRYTDSAHERNDECEDRGRKFISNAYRVSFLEKLADEALAEDYRRNLLGMDLKNHEVTSLERAGLQVHEQRGAPQVSLASLPSQIDCPIDGCDVKLAPGEVRSHVDTHAAADPEPVQHETPAKTATATRPRRARRPARK